MPLTLYFLRHGQTPCSRLNLFCGSGQDTELTEDGLEMGRAFASAYSGRPWNAIYSSPLQRTRITAETIARDAGATIELREELMEIGYGQWEGRTIEEVDREHHDDYIRWQADPAWHAPTGGEPAGEIARRGLKVVEEITERFPSGEVLVVSHKATIRIILCSLLGIDVGRFRYRLACPVGSVSTVEFSMHGPLLRTLADRAHLDERLRSLPGT